MFDAWGGKGIHLIPLQKPSVLKSVDSGGDQKVSPPQKIGACFRHQVLVKSPQLLVGKVLVVNFGAAKNW
jgi:hypothetical protein